jgi:hypothetical protein
MMKPRGKPDPKKPGVCSVCAGYGIVEHGGVTKKCNACKGTGKG